MTFFFNSQLGLLRSLRSNDLRCWISEAATSKFCNCSRKFGFSSRKDKEDICMTNGSKVLIYLTLLFFLLHYVHEYSKFWSIAKSNKSELWNHLSKYITSKILYCQKMRVWSGHFRWPIPLNCGQSLILLNWGQRHYQ